MQTNNFFTRSNFLLLSILFLLVTSFSISSSFLFYPRVVNAQPITLKDMITYEKQSNFIKEFKIPLAGRGLKGITTDTLGNAWFYHSTFNRSTIVRLEPITMKFTAPKAGPMGIVLSPDGKNIWFAEITGNKIASLDIQSNKIIEYPVMGSASSSNNNGILSNQDNGPTFLT